MELHKYSSVRFPPPEEQFMLFLLLFFSSFFTASGVHATLDQDIILTILLSAKKKYIFYQKLQASKYLNSKFCKRSCRGNVFSSSPRWHRICCSTAETICFYGTGSAPRSAALHCWHKFRCVSKKALITTQEAAKAGKPFQQCRFPLQHPVLEKLLCQRIKRR